LRERGLWRCRFFGRISERRMYTWHAASRALLDFAFWELQGIFRMLSINAMTLVFLGYMYDLGRCYDLSSGVMVYGAWRSHFGSSADLKMD
jgi:hypothetical protein